MNNEERNIKLCQFQMLKNGSSPPYCVAEKAPLTVLAHPLNTI